MSVLSPQSLVHRPSLLGVYLNDHLAGATAGVELSARIAREHREGPHGTALARLAREIGEDRAALVEIIGSLGLPTRAYKQVAGWTMEKLGRFKPNGHLLSRSPLSSLVEFEALRLGVGGKIACWSALRDLAVGEPRLDRDRLDALRARGERQAALLDDLHARAAASALGAS